MRARAKVRAELGSKCSASRAVRRRTQKTSTVMGRDCTAQRLDAASMKLHPELHAATCCHHEPRGSCCHGSRRASNCFQLVVDNFGPNRMIPIPGAREYQRLHAEPRPRLHLEDFGAGQTVAVVDTGAPPFLYYNFMPGGRPKLLGELDMTSTRCMPSRPRWTAARNASATAQLRPLAHCGYAQAAGNHVAKGVSLAWWSSMGVPHDLGNQTGSGASLVSLRFASALYARTKTGRLFDVEAWLASLTRCLMWVNATRGLYSITTVQLGAIDGGYDDNDARFRALSSFQLFHTLTRTLWDGGVWLSAPTGNDPHADGGRASFPASHAAVQGVSCASVHGEIDGNWSMVARYFAVASPHSSRTASLLFVPSPLPFTSGCNEVLCAISVVLRGVIARRCGVPATAILPKHLVWVLRQSARRVWDARSKRHHYVVETKRAYGVAQHSDTVVGRVCRGGSWGLKR